MAPDRAAPPAPFARTAEGHLTCAVGRARVRFTGRLGGVSTGPYAALNLGSWTDDDPAAVRTNRAILAGYAGVGPERIAQARQTHGTTVRTVAATADLPGPDLADVREADGVATALPGTPCVVLCADCVPVALVADDAVAMVHAGWRGLVGGVIESGLRALAAVGGGDPVGVTALIGPSAGPCCYQVGDEVHAALASSATANGDPVRVGDRADLWAAATGRLRTAGVTRVHAARACTICDPEHHFSHRRDAGATGRQAGMAWLS